MCLTAVEILCHFSYKTGGRIGTPNTILSTRVHIHVRSKCKSALEVTACYMSAPSSALQHSQKMEARQPAVIG